EFDHEGSRRTSARRYARRPITVIDYDKFREAGRIAAAAREHAKALITPGRLMREVVESCEAKIFELGGKLAFPAQISKNHIAAHYCPRPDDTTLIEDGDILKLDCGVHVDGYVADNAVTVDLRDGPDGALTCASRMALENVIAMIGPGVAVRDIGRTIQETIESMGFKPVFNLTGHGVARWSSTARLRSPTTTTSARASSSPARSSRASPSRPTAAATSKKSANPRSSCRAGR
ncbi:MAG TPA: M24 family metallopeptidase, partial [Planctomycetota bacterium]|nr:M24 family metallopeptidase [Planctomycetota bacterium]